MRPDRLDHDIAKLERKVSELRLESDATLARLRERAQASLTSPASLVAAAAVGIAAACMSDTHEQGRTRHAGLVSRFIAVTGAIGTLARIGALVRTFTSQYLPDFEPAPENPHSQEV